MQIPCMVLIIEDVVFHVFLLLGFALVQCALTALAGAGAVSVRLHLIIPSPHSGLQLERESHRHDSYPQVSRVMGAWVPPTTYNNIMS